MKHHFIFFNLFLYSTFLSAEIFDFPYESNCEKKYEVVKYCLDRGQGFDSCSRSSETGNSPGFNGNIEYHRTEVNCSGSVPAYCRNLPKDPYNRPFYAAGIAPQNQYGVNQQHICGMSLGAYQSFINCTGPASEQFRDYRQKWCPVGCNDYARLMRSMNLTNDSINFDSKQCHLSDDQVNNFKGCSVLRAQSDLTLTQTLEERIASNPLVQRCTDINPGNPSACLDIDEQQRIGGKRSCSIEEISQIDQSVKVTNFAYATPPEIQFKMRTEIGRVDSSGFTPYDMAKVAAGLQSAPFTSARGWNTGNGNDLLFVTITKTISGSISLCEQGASNCQSRELRNGVFSSNGKGGLYQAKGKDIWNMSISRHWTQLEYNKQYNLTVTTSAGKTTRASFFVPSNLYVKDEPEPVCGLWQNQNNSGAPDFSPRPPQTDNSPQYYSQATNCEPGKAEKDNTGSTWLCELRDCNTVNTASNSTTENSNIETSSTKENDSVDTSIGGLNISGAHSNTVTQLDPNEDLQFSITGATLENTYGCTLYYAPNSATPNIPCEAQDFVPMSGVSRSVWENTNTNGFQIKSGVSSVDIFGTVVEQGGRMISFFTTQNPNDTDFVKPTAAMDHTYATSSNSSSSSSSNSNANSNLSTNTNTNASASVSTDTQPSIINAGINFCGNDSPNDGSHICFWIVGENFKINGDYINDSLVVKAINCATNESYSSGPSGSYQDLNKEEAEEVPSGPFSGKDRIRHRAHNSLLMALQNSESIKFQVIKGDQRSGFSDCKTAPPVINPN